MYDTGYFMKYNISQVFIGGSLSTKEKFFMVMIRNEFVSQLENLNLCNFFYCYYHLN